ncbi:MAG: hypothetical protein WCH04_01115 [Gammaproteobacteria bacterium]
MKLSTNHTSIGRVITIEVDEVLDLQSHGIFVDACKLAEHHDQNTIDVNLRNTRNIRDSGLAMLLMLREITGCESDSIRLVNFSPEIRGQLITSKVGKQFHIV